MSVGFRKPDPVNPPPKYTLHRVVKDSREARLIGPQYTWGEELRAVVEGQLVYSRLFRLPNGAAMLEQGWQRAER